MADVKPVVTRSNGSSLIISTVPVGQIDNIGEIGAEREIIEIKMLDSEYVHKLGDIVDSGSVDVGGYFYPEEAGQLALEEAFGMGEAVPCAVIFGRIKFMFDAVVASYKIGGAAPGEPIKYSASLAISGKINKELVTK